MMNLNLPTSAGGSRPGTAPAIAPLTFDVPFEVKELLWEQVKKYLKVSEVDEIKRILGRGLIEENEGLLQEINSLLDIWKDFKVQIEDQIKAATPRSRPKLPEPPGRDLLETKITLLLNDLKNTALEHGKDITSTIPLETPRDKEIFTYFEKEAALRPRSASVSERDFRKSFDKPVETRQPSSARAATSLSLERITHCLNVHDIQNVQVQIREALQDENRVLKEDAEYLQKCLENEWSFKNKAIAAVKTQNNNPPPLHELKEFGNKLEKKILSQGSPKKVVGTSLLSQPTRPTTALPPPKLPPKFEDKKLLAL